MARGGENWIRVVEAAYTLDSSTEQWMDRLAAHVEPILDSGLGSIVQIARTLPDDIRSEHLLVRGPPPLAHAVTALSEGMSWENLERMLGYGSAARTLSEVVYANDPSHARSLHQLSGALFADVLVVVCRADAGRTLFFAAPLAAARPSSGRERQHLNRVAAHVGTALRLRTRIGELDLDDEQRTEAIFRPDGKVLDARGRATPASARERLRQAVLQCERARGPLREAEPSEVLPLWEALVSGRWSLVDHFDSDGTRMVVAVENTPSVCDPRGLTTAQLSIAEEFGRGKSAKEIGYLLGISVSAINNALSEVRSKLGLRSRVELAAFFAPGGVRARLAQLDLKEASLLVGRYGGRADDVLADLTDAERQVAVELMQGATNEEIARKRGTSYNTVANQLKAVYAKLGVTNRAELTTLAARPPSICERVG